MDVKQTLTGANMDTFRVNFDPAIPHQEIMDYLHDLYDDNIEITEPAPLFQAKLPLIRDNIKLSEQVFPYYLEQV